MIIVIIVLGLSCVKCDIKIFVGISFIYFFSDFRREVFYVYFIDKERRFKEVNFFGRLRG